MLCSYLISLPVFLSYFSTFGKQVYDAWQPLYRQAKIPCEGPMGIIGVAGVE